MKSARDLDAPMLRLARLLLGEPDGVYVVSMSEVYEPELACSTVDLRIRVSDEGKMAMTSEEEEREEDEVTAVERPTSHSITIVGVCNLEVRWDKEYGLFRLMSVCPSCGRKFERTMRGFVTKELVAIAHDLGFKLGEHLERHQSFGDYLRKLRQGEAG